MGCFVKLALVWWLDFSTIYWQWILKNKHTFTEMVILQKKKKVHKISIFWSEKYLMHKISLAYTWSTVLWIKTIIWVMIKKNSVCYYYCRFQIGAFVFYFFPWTLTHKEHWFSVTALCIVSQKTEVSQCIWYPHTGNITHHSNWFYFFFPSLLLLV